MVYLIHFHKKFKHAQHYIGYSETPATFKRRIDHHRSGAGAKLLRCVNEAGIEWEVVRIWDDGTRDFERSLKNKKHSQRLCPLCKK